MEDFVARLQVPWFFFPIGYVFTIAIETPILCVALSREHRMPRRILTGLWLTACTYPIVVFVVPREPYWAYLLIAESVAHFGECALFYAAFRPLTQPLRDLAAVFGANLASFGLGILAYWALLRYV